MSVIESVHMTIIGWRVNGCVNWEVGHWVSGMKFKRIFTRHLDTGDRTTNRSTKLRAILEITPLIGVINCGVRSIVEIWVRWWNRRLTVERLTVERLTEKRLSVELCRRGGRQQYRRAGSHDDGLL